MNGLADASPRPVTGQHLDNRRLAAAAVDVLLLAPVAFAIQALCGGFGLTAALLTSAWALYYYFAFESGTGQTIGKRLLGLRVVRADGGAPTMGEIAVRTALRVVDGLGAYLVGLGVMLSTGQRRQRLGDIVAGTVVTAAEAPAAEPVPGELGEPAYAYADAEVDAPTEPLPGLEDYSRDEEEELPPEAVPYEPVPMPEVEDDDEIHLPDFSELPPAASAPPPPPPPPAASAPPPPPPPPAEPTVPELPSMDPTTELPPMDSAVPPPPPPPDEPALEARPDPELPVFDPAPPPPAYEPSVEVVDSPFSDDPVPVAEADSARIDLPPPASAIDLLMEEQAADDDPPASR